MVWFNPLRPWTLEETNYRTHRKVLVADGAVAFTGGVGIADHWLGNAQDPRPLARHAVPGDRARRCARSRRRSTRTGSSRAARRRPRSIRSGPPQGTGARSIVVWSNPTGGASNVKLLYLLSIAGARATIDIQSPYFILDESTRWSLDDARAGAACACASSPTATSPTRSRSSTRAATAIRRLLDSGYEIFEYQPTMMHVKAMMVDGVWSVIGIGQLRQSIVRAERRAHRGRGRSRARRRVDRGLRARSAARGASRVRRRGAIDRCSRRAARDSGRCSGKSSDRGA